MGEGKLSFKQALFIDFLVCFIFGIILSNLLGSDAFQKQGNLTHYYLQQFQYTQFQFEDLLWHIGSQRIVLFFLLLAFSLLSKGKIVHTLFVAWCGFAYGFFCVMLIAACGAKGLLVCMSALCPHFFAYVPAYLGMVQLSDQRRTTSKWGRWGAVGVIFLLVIVGILLESYANPMLIQKILNFF